MNHIIAILYLIFMLVTLKCLISHHRKKSFYYDENEEADHA